MLAVATATCAAEQLGSASAKRRHAITGQPLLRASTARRVSADGTHARGLHASTLHAAGAPARSGAAATVLQIVNNVAGCGILPLAAGMAAGVGWIPAMAMGLVRGAISGFTFYRIGASCDLTGCTSFKDLWSATLGPSTSWVVDGTIALMCFSAAIIYSGILGDAFGALASLGGAKAPAAFLRRACIIVLTGLVLTPLTLLKDLSALSFTSALGCAAVLYTGIFVALRALDGTYRLGTDSALLASLPPHLTPSFARASLMRFDKRALVLVSNLGMAFIAHYNAPAFYESLEDHTPARWGRVCALSFAVLSLLYAAMMGFGYATFGDTSSANLLLNYAEADALAVVGRLATGASILFGYPLVMVGLRNAITGVCASLGGADDKTASPFRKAMRGLCPEGARVPLTLTLLGTITAIACTISDIGTIVGIAGALLGAAIVYTYPPLMYAAARRATPNPAPAAVYALVPLGAFLGILGTYVTLT